jgi:hypothetical protein
MKKIKEIHFLNSDTLYESDLPYGQHIAHVNSLIKIEDKINELVKTLNLLSKAIK